MVKQIIRIAFSMLAIASVMTVASAKHHPRKKTSERKHVSVERRSTEKALAKLQQEIAKYESELKEHEKSEKHSRETIQAFEKRQKSLTATIANLEREESEMQGQKTEVDRSITETNQTLESRKAAYARSSRELYMQSTLARTDPDWLILNTETSEAETSEADPIRMSYYAAIIAHAHGMDRARLDSMKTTLGASSAALASSIENEDEQIGAHQAESSSIDRQKTQEANTLAQIQAKKDRLKKLVAERKASERKLENIIAGLVAKEGSTRRSSRRTRRTESENDVALGPAHGPHSLDWPTSSHRISQAFGEHRNEELGTVTMNLGIDIGTPQGSSVRATAEGEVALVSSLPSYGTVIVIRHSGNLHTVYANLSGAAVREGTHVRSGETIGASGTSEMSGAALHFEVWKGKTKQNPAGWLK